MVWRASENKRTGVAYVPPNSDRGGARGNVGGELNSNILDAPGRRIDRAQSQCGATGSCKSDEGGSLRTEPEREPARPDDA